MRLVVWVALAGLATLLAVAPAQLPGAAAIPFGIFFAFFLPGYLFERILFPDRGEITLTRLPAFFVFGLAVWALPATALQLLGSNWLTFRIVFVAGLWTLTLAAWWRTAPIRETFEVLETSKVSRESATSVSMRNDRLAEIVVGVLCVIVALVVWAGPRDADDWGYLQITQQFIGSDPFRILAASEARYSLRYAFHIWIFLQAFLGQWFDADVVTLLRDWLPALLAPLALISFYGWAREFFGRTNAALVAVVIQLVIYVTWANMDGWGRGFFVRSAQDKFLVWLIVLPLAFTFAWRFLGAGKTAHWIAFGAVIVAGLWVHPVSLFLVVIGLAGFALFNLLSRAPFPRKRWLALVVAAIPALLAPLVIRVTTLPVVFTVNSPEVEAYIRISDGRLLFQGPFYIADPLLLANPIVLFSLPLVVLFAANLRPSRSFETSKVLDSSQVSGARIQFLWGTTLVPLALVFNPFTAKILGEMLTPWQLWRVTWLVPSAFILTETLLYFGATERSRRPALAVALAVTALLAFSLSTPNFARVISNFQQDHALEPQVEDMLRVLDRTLTQPANVMLPRRLTRFAPAYSYNAIVLSNDAQKPEDTRGQQIDRFYDPQADPKFLEAFLVFWQSEYVVAENDSLQDTFLKTHPRATFLYKNTALTLYRIAPP